MNRFSNNTQISNVMKIRPMGADLLHVGGRTDMMKLIVAFHSFANAPNTWVISGKSFVWSTPRTVGQKVVNGQFSFQGFNFVYRWSCKEYALAIRVSLQIGGGRWFSWEDARYLPGLVEYAFCSLTVSLWCNHVWGTRYKEFSYRRTPLSRIKWDVEPSGYAEKRTTGRFFENGLHWQLEV